MVRIMDNSKEKQAYEDWFNSSFSNDEVQLLAEIGVICKADQNFFKNEMFDISEYLDNPELQNYEDLYRKFIERYISLIPKLFHHQIEKKLIMNDQYYRAWFYNRKCFMEKIDTAREEARKVNPWSRDYLLWSPIVDNNCPEECKKLNNKVYHVMDDDFIQKTDEHWAEINRGCRCALISLNRAEVDKRQQMG